MFINQRIKIGGEITLNEPNNDRLPLLDFELKVLFYLK